MGQLLVFLGTSALVIVTPGQDTALMAVFLASLLPAFAPGGAFAALVALGLRIATTER